MESALDHDTALALLSWHIELGATEAIGDVPVDCYALPAAMPGTKPASTKPKPVPPAGTAAVPPPSASEQVDPVAVAQAAAAAAPTLTALRAALAAFDLCEIKKGARNLVFGDGAADARVMVIGSAPGREDDRDGRPFAGEVGQLVNRMLAAIDLDRDSSVYLTHVLPWRPPQDRPPMPAEIAMIKPFLARHVALADPDVIVLMGNASCEAAWGKTGIKRLRGTWAEAFGRPALAMLHPADLMTTPAAKRAAWADLLTLKARLRDG